MKGRVCFLVAALVTLLLPQAVGAHHGGAAYDQSQSLNFTGTVTELRFANPHVLLFFDVTKDGKTEKWSGWLTAPTKLARAGWTKNTLKPGDQVTLTARPHKGGEHVLQIRTLAGPNGVALPLSED
jgi:hypothetical protein